MGYVVENLLIDQKQSA
jgi:hypothetical protein